MTVNQFTSRGDTPPTALTSVASDGRDDTPRDVGEGLPDNADSSVAFDELLDLLGDEYVTDILQALSSGAMPARAIADECGMSRPTAYRRLDRLTEAGVVASRLSPEPDGHHRQEFRLILDEVAVRFREDGVDGRARLREPVSD
jgi:DNA-binding transcriptional ArsR family regulator